MWHREDNACARRVRDDLDISFKLRDECFRETGSKAAPPRLGWHATSAIRHGYANRCPNLLLHRHVNGSHTFRICVLDSVREQLRNHKCKYDGPVSRQKNGRCMDRNMLIPGASPNLYQAIAQFAQIRTELDILGLRPSRWCKLGSGHQHRRSGRSQRSEGRFITGSHAGHRFQRQVTVL